MPQTDSPELQRLGKGIDSVQGHAHLLSLTVLVMLVLALAFSF
jgi:hypothetical protein